MAQRMWLSQAGRGPNNRNKEVPQTVPSPPPLLPASPWSLRWAQAGPAPAQGLWGTPNPPMPPGLGEGGEVRVAAKEAGL